MRLRGGYGGLARCGGAALPEPDYGEGAGGGEDEDGEGDDPGYVVEAAAHGSGEDGGAVLGGEPLEDGFVGGSGGDLGVEFADHDGGVGAADVVALDQDLAAAAGADELVADAVVLGAGGADHGDGDEAEEGDLEVRAQAMGLRRLDAGERQIRRFRLRRNDGLEEWRGFAGMTDLKCGGLGMGCLCQCTGEDWRGGGWTAEGSSWRWRRAGRARLGARAMKVPMTTMTTPTQIQAMSGSDHDVDDGLAGVGVAALEDGVEVAFEAAVDGGDGGGLFVVGAGEVDAFFGGELGDLFAVAEDVEEGEVGVVLGLGVLGDVAADEGVGADGEGVAVGHVPLARLVECSAGDADEHDHDAEVDDVSAVAAGVAADEE